MPGTTCGPRTLAPNRLVPGGGSDASGYRRSHSNRFRPGCGRHDRPRWRRTEERAPLAASFARQVLAAAERPDRLAALVEHVERDTVRRHVFQARTRRRHPTTGSDPPRTRCAATATATAGAHAIGLARLEQMHGRGRHLRVHLAERREVVEDPERAPLRRGHQVRALTARSVIGTTGRFSCSGCHVTPSSNDTWTPVSVPA